MTKEPQDIIEIERKKIMEIACLAFEAERYGRLLRYSLISLVNNCEELSEEWKISLSMLKHFEELLIYSKQTTNLIIFLQIFLRIIRHIRNSFRTL